MKRLLILAGVALGLVTVGLLVFVGASCAATSCHSGGPGVSSGHHHGAAAGSAAGAADAAASGFANTKCPIMGGAIDPAKVPESLTRVYKGRKVAFCCGMCPAKWDKLSDAEKDAKLQ